MKKVLSILLIAAAAFGFYGGAVSINDVLSSKAYWEEEGRKTTKDLNKLEDGLNQLKANTTAYKDGLKSYNEGLVTLADGKAQYAAGEKALADAESQYGGPGVPTLALLYSTINSMIDAKGNLNKAAAIVANNSGGQLSATQAIQIFNNVNELYAGYEPQKAYATVASTAGKTPEEVQAAYEGVDNAKAVYENVQKLIDLFNDVKYLMEKTFVHDLTDAACAEVAIENFEITKDSPELEEKYNIIKFQYTNNAPEVVVAVETIKGTYSALIDAGATSTPESVVAAASSIVASQATPPAEVDKIQSIYSIVSGLISAGEIEQRAAYAAVAKSANPTMPLDPENPYYKAGVGQIETLYTTVAKMIEGKDLDFAYQIVAQGAGISDAGSIKDAYENTAAFYNGVTFDQAVGVVAAAQKMDPAMVKQGYEGYKTYVSGKKQLAESLPQIQAGETQLADGKKQLDQYRDGEKTLREGLATLMGTKADPGLKSIAARVGEKETFTGADGFFNFDAGYKGVKMGRAYQDDTGALITKELTGRAIGFGVGIGAGVVALLAAILGLLKKNKGAAVAGLIAAATAGFGAYYVKAAGTFYTEGAGSTVGNMPMIAMCVLAGVAVIFAIAHFTAPKAEVEAKKEA